MTRRLNVAPEAAQMLPAAHLAQLESDVLNADNRCLICGELIDGPEAELVVLHDDRAILARMAHPACTVSGAYAWERTSDAIAALAGQMEGVDLSTALVWRPTAVPRAMVLAEPLIHVSAESDDDDPLERLFAEPLGLAPVSAPVAELAPPISLSCRVHVEPAGLVIVSERLRLGVPSDAETVARWRAHVDDDRALVIIGRGLGLGRDDRPVGVSLSEALRSRPVYAATVAVVSG